MTMVRHKERQCTFVGATFVEMVLWALGVERGL